MDSQFAFDDPEPQLRERLVGVMQKHGVVKGPPGGVRGVGIGFLSGETGTLENEKNPRNGGIPKRAIAGQTRYNKPPEISSIGPTHGKVGWPIQLH